MTAVERLAVLLLERLQIQEKPDLLTIASKIGLRVKEVEVDGFDGMLVRSLDGPKGIIAVRRSIREPARKRFTIAHEIGHYVIPTHRKFENFCVAETVESWSQFLATPEREANQFAAELLLPASLVRGPLNLNEPSLRTIGNVATEFGTSLTATMCRFIDLTDMACAMIWSEKGTAEWYRRSEAFPFFLPKSYLPASQSFAGMLFSCGTAPKGFQPINPELWLERRDAQKAGILLEYSVLLSKYRAVLTLLWAQDIEPTALLEDHFDEEDGEWDPFNALHRKRWPR